MNKLGYMKNQADLCLYYQWYEEHRLIVWLSFIDNMLIICKEDAMEGVKKKFTEIVDCEDIGEMHEYIGTKIDDD